MGSPGLRNSEGHRTVLLRWLGATLALLIGAMLPSCSCGGSGERQPCVADAECPDRELCYLDGLCLSEDVARRMGGLGNECGPELPCTNGVCWAGFCVGGADDGGTDAASTDASDATTEAGTDAGSDAASDSATSPDSGGVACGNGTCDAALAETCSTCPVDCGSCCGDGVCEPAAAEDCTSCTVDCGACPLGCGDGWCDTGTGENCGNCAADCPCCGAAAIPPPGIDFTTQILPILADSAGVLTTPCTGCHSAGGGLANLDLTSHAGVIAGGDTGSEVAPCDCSNSNIWMKTSDMPPFGVRMPLDGPPWLPEPSRLLICDWINQGALATYTPWACGGPPVCDYCGDGSCSPTAGEDCLNCEADCGMCAAGCGDGTCDTSGGEDCGSCPMDCGTCCGDGFCDVTIAETCTSCAADCTTCCGDGTCEAGVGEDCAACATDCGSCCGDGTCDPAVGEDCGSCASDCPTCCGDATCDAAGGEDCAACAADCGSCCGNGACEVALGESCTACAADCSACCGDGTCEPLIGEDCGNCGSDCGACCGNGVCDTAYGEDCNSCAGDCGACPLSCGDGWCDTGGGEDCGNCSTDCPCCGAAAVPPPLIDYWTQIQPILDDAAGALNTACTGCHGAGGGSGNLDLTTFTGVIAGGNNGSEVSACDCANSNIWLKTGTMPPFGGRMPANGPPWLPDPSRNLICDWINQGALELPTAWACGGPPICDYCGDMICTPTAGEDCNSCDFDCGACPLGCGDGTCDGTSGENCVSCSADCGACCGDGICDAAIGETCGTCATDCTTCCGDGTCEAGLGEDCSSCASDCGACCGDGLCDPLVGETCGTCASDCPTCCGDGSCDMAGGEDCLSCGTDCGSCCGNGVCEAGLGESCATCAGDCTTCCGDGTCDVLIGEDCGNCGSDCGSCCGNGVCDAGYGESCSSCVGDCGMCPSGCGDGWCDTLGGEDCGNCAADCPCCGDAAVPPPGIDFWSQIQPILNDVAGALNTPCTGCHTASGGDSGLNLTSYSGVIAGGDNGSEVSACNCANSNIWRKTGTSPPFGGRMPEDGPPWLPAPSRDLICEWIDQGALEFYTPWACGGPPMCDYCGDLTCAPTAGEDCSTCEFDCGMCPLGCGDGSCDTAGGETCSTCSADCGSCCGDGICDPALSETCTTCVADCTTCCGDGTCEAGIGEDCVSCVTDCATCPDTNPPTFGGLQSTNEPNMTSCDLSWNAATDDVTPQSQIVYEIFVVIEGGAFNFSMPYDVTTPGATMWTITLTPGERYDVIVRAVDQAGNSDNNMLDERCDVR